MSSDDLAIEVEQVSKRYEIYAAPHDRLKQMFVPPMARAVRGLAARVGLGSRAAASPQFFKEFWALRDISVTVRKGETLGIIGRNGSGKSTLLQIIAGTMAPTTGRVQTRGRVAALLELGSGFNPEFTGRENVYLNSAILGMTREQTDRRLDAILAFADIGEFVDEPVKTYSSGMFVRLAFAVQAHIEAGVVLIDEALAVGDIFFRQKCYARLEQLRASGAAIVLVSHSMPDVEQFCERAILLDHGHMRFSGSSVEAAKHYYLLHQQVHFTGAEEPAVRADPAASIRPEAAGWVPPRDAFVDLSRKSQVSNGWARCVGVAVCNQQGEACAAFRQGDTAIFHYEFEVSRPVGAVIGGIVIASDKGIIVHGKNSWQYADAEAAVPVAHARVLFTQSIEMNLAMGEYTIEVGLASVTPADWANRARISHDEMALRHLRICHVPDAAVFSVALAMRDGVPTLTHHGIADLPGSMRSRVAPAVDDERRHDEQAL